ncbi:hypothetical protein OC846_004006 [Tilletia horrida]|uniref:Uncharacterized protein n=1 Tax=Tilletia horrida TaxID=155126 RepID=A0AAN6GN13_9BASI|nr:hypothetical protein OC846_004006 [Tilletia horrida]
MTGHPYIMAGYYVLFVFNIAAWIVIDTQFDGVEIPLEFRAPGGVKCAPKPVPWYAVFAWGSNLLFDAATLIGTYWKLRTIRKGNGLRRALENRTHRFIWRSNLLYAYGLSDRRAAASRRPMPTMSYKVEELVTVHGAEDEHDQRVGDLDRPVEHQHHQHHPHHDGASYTSGSTYFKSETNGAANQALEQENSTSFNATPHGPWLGGGGGGAAHDAVNSGQGRAGHEWTMGLSGSGGDPRRRSSGSQESSSEGVSEAERKRAAALEQTIRATYPRLSGFVKPDHLKSTLTPTRQPSRSRPPGDDSADRPSTAGETSGMASPRASSVVLSANGERIEIRRSVLETSAGPGQGQVRMDSPFQDPSAIEHCKDTSEEEEEEEEAAGPLPGTTPTPTPTRNLAGRRSEPAALDVVQERMTRSTPPRTGGVRLGRTSTFGHGSVTGTEDSRSIETSRSSPYRAGPSPRPTKRHEEDREEEDMETSSTVQHHHGDRGGGDQSLELRSPLSPSSVSLPSRRSQESGARARGGAAASSLEQDAHDARSYSLSAAMVSQVSCRIGHGAGDSLELPDSAAEGDDSSSAYHARAI